MNHRLVHRALRAFLLLFLAVATSAAMAAGYTARAGKIYDAAGQEVQLRGISHFGFNATILQPQYLWAMGWKQQIAQIKSMGFNAIRVPFVPDTLYNTTPVNQLSYIDTNLNAEFIGKTPLQALDLWMAEADRQGMYVLLDFHSVSMMRQYPTWFVSDPADFGLIYNKQAYTKANWTRDLAFVAKRYASLPHFFAIDIYNEPNGIVRWSTGDANAANPVNFWKGAAEAASAAVLAANPNLMIFVQGINGNYDGLEKSNVPMNWGEDFQPQAYQPLNIPSDKLVLSPHTYGPDVYVKSSFGASNFPVNLAADWETLFGQFSPAHPVVVGEWGGRYGNGTGGQADVRWQNAFVDYLVSKGIRSSFYWSYTPNSGDTGGILDDNLVPRQDKLALLHRHWGSAMTPTTSTPALTSSSAASPNPPAATTPQQGITNFTPSSGPAGTVVTVNGSGFTGSTLASVGAGGKTALTVVGDTQVRLTISGGATTGAIGIFNPSHAAFSATAFAVASAPATGVQPGIAGFSPTSGPVGTVVTLKGAGFSGANAAWVGTAKGAPLHVLSDSQIQVTIPPGATSGAIGIFNASHVAFTASTFTVSGSAAVYQQPAISSFSPSVGPIGTVVTVKGNGFTGINLAWVGNARNASVRVLSDTQLQLTVPAGATSGSIGLFNPTHVAFAASWFTVK